ncbi:DNA-binding transcriptional regulator DsdC [Acinetobacter bereziniae]|uniref:DNA-binding transcriptional regulator DsdC n=1 Tax=Acinetobacter bereziniae TaxID=106648 RepID=UPI000C2C6855|nr:DNA-binding transcriptional regulator DsdC [Acinetobacter bereziniae]ATZ62845.1 colanic acid biosynthesis glycosyltransferase WcaA [Acinetobacter bereziniae]MCU4316417.1 DNA-binding transcriptional regulator DsdC [Acinetobacter bereziniae]
MNNAHKNLTGFQLSKLYTFEVAARHESFALAAEELFLTPSAVSHQINQLEKELEIKLFLRLHRKVKLTPEGTRILDALQYSLDVLNSEINALKNQSLVGALTLYARPSIAQCWLLPHLADFIQRYPHIQLSILTGNENVNFQRTGIDLALYFDHQPSTQLNYQYLMDESIIPVCSPEYAEKIKLNNNLEKLKDCTLLHDCQAWSNGTGTEEWNSWAQHFRVPIEHLAQLSFDRSDLTLTAAKNHLGVAMGRKKLIENDLKNGALIMPFQNMELKCEQHYYLVSLKNNVLPKVKVFSDWLLELVKKNQPIEEQRVIKEH